MTSHLSISGLILLSPFLISFHNLLYLLSHKRLYKQPAMEVMEIKVITIWLKSMINVPAVFNIESLGGHTVGVSV